MFAPYESQRRSVYAPHSDELITRQEMRDECDIYVILDRAARTGVIDHLNAAQPSFEDLPSGLDYQEAMNQVLQAQAVFDDLPSAVRDEFHNSPAEFLSAFQDDAQRDRLQALGLLKPLPPAPVQAPDGTV